MSTSPIKRVDCIIRFVFSFVTAIILVVNILFGNRIFACKQSAYSFPTWMYILVGCVVIVALTIVFAHRSISAPKCVRRVRMLLGSLALFIVLVVLAYHYYFVTRWDISAIFEAVNYIRTGDEHYSFYYMSLYPNNLLLAWIFSVTVEVGEWLGISNAYICPIILQCFLFSVAGYLFWEAADDLFGERLSFSAWVLYVVVVGVSPWVVVPYSDATGVIFPVAMIFLVAKIERCKSQWMKWIMAFLCGCLIAFGFNIKPQAGITGIAVVALLVCSVFQKVTKKASKVGYKEECILLCLLVGIMGAGVLVNICKDATNIDVNKELSMTPTHYLMMGLNKEANGVCTYEDAMFSREYENKKERQLAELQVVQQRLSDYGVLGTLEHLKKKILTTYADGSFAWWIEGSFYGERRWEGNQRLRELLETYYYRDGESHAIFMNQAQFWWMGILVLNGVACFSKKRDLAWMVCLLSLSGLFLFQCLFEARARYLFTQVPIFILVAYGGMEVLHARMSNIGKR